MILNDTQTKHNQTHGKHTMHSTSKQKLIVSFNANRIFQAHIQHTVTLRERHFAGVWCLLAFQNLQSVSKSIIIKLARGKTLGHSFSKFLAQKYVNKMGSPSWNICRCYIWVIFHTARNSWYLPDLWLTRHCIVLVKGGLTLYPNVHWKTGYCGKIGSYFGISQFSRQ